MFYFGNIHLLSESSQILSLLFSSPTLEMVKLKVPQVSLELDIAEKYLKKKKQKQKTWEKMKTEILALTSR